MTYNSAPDTLQHIQTVRNFIIDIAGKLKIRSIYHDNSKLNEPEKGILDKFTPLLRNLTYGSDEYNACLVEMGAGLEHHYAHNSHHPEHWPVPETVEIAHLKLIVGGMDPTHPAIPYLLLYLNELESRINGMSLLDVTEMLADWRGAVERHADGDIRKSLEINRVRFKMSHQLYQIFKNTLNEMGW